MTITISSELESSLRERAAAGGVSIEAYIEQLVREDGDWREFDSSLEPAESPDTAAAVSRGLNQALRGTSRPAAEVFERLRSTHGISR